MNRLPYSDRFGGSGNLIPRNTESTTLLPLPYLQSQLQLVEDQIRVVIWEHATSMRDEDELIDRHMTHLEEVRFQAEVTHQTDALDNDLEYKNTKGQLVTTVGTTEEVRPIVEPLIEKRAKYLKQLRYLEKTNPLYN